MMNQSDDFSAATISNRLLSFKQSSRFLLSCLAVGAMALCQAGCKSQTPMKSSPDILHSVSSSDAVKAGLPAVEIQVSKINMPLTVREFPYAAAYLSLSGPPGGPLGLSVTAGPAALDDMVKLLRQDGHQDAQTGEVSFQGKKVSAISSTAGQENARHTELNVLAGTAGGKGIWITVSAPPAGKPASPAQLGVTSPYLDLLGAVQLKVP